MTSPVCATIHVWETSGRECRITPYYIVVLGPMITKPAAVAFISSEHQYISTRACAWPLTPPATRDGLTQWFRHFLKTKRRKGAHSSSTLLFQISKRQSNSATSLFPAVLEQWHEKGINWVHYVLEIELQYVSLNHGKY